MQNRSAETAKNCVLTILFVDFYLALWSRSTVEVEVKVKVKGQFQYEMFDKY